jgi:hypothetical protein
MARKTLAAIDPKLTRVLEEFQAVSLVKYEMARDAYDIQDKDTQAAIDRIHGTLQQYATGYINLKVGRSIVPVKIDNEYLGYNLLFLAVEIAKDLAFTGIRLANFKVPDVYCATCGDLIPELTNSKGRRTRGS